VDAQLQRQVTLHSIGGFVLTTLYGLPRTTDDLDYISVLPPDAYAAIDEIAGPGSRLAKHYKVSIHSAGAVVDLPDDYESRLQVIPLPFRQLHIAVPDPYDLALSKLTRNSPKDREDVRFLAARCQLSFRTLVDRFNSEMDWIPNAERHQTTLDVVWRDLGCWVDVVDGSLSDRDQLDR
jgi:hypothetical protein